MIICEMNEEEFEWEKSKDKIQREKRYVLRHRFERFSEAFHCLDFEMLVHDEINSIYRIEVYRLNVKNQE